jgi:hypothetical protein
MTADELRTQCRELLPPGWTAGPHPQEWVGVLHGHDYGYVDGVIINPPGSVGLNYELLPLVDGRVHAQANGEDVLDGTVADMGYVDGTLEEVMRELLGHESRVHGQYEVE